ncbi:phosphonopyruvate decarboxylase [Planosporangium sp. 12N6]|uniref:phosphonopyruvate decarboxylase n=1 Tax=Planosporangium spinosum TaxID=3402278 RepID=UPI003CEB2C74
MSGYVSARELLHGLAQLGSRLVTGVPCSFFGGPIRLLEAGYDGLTYVPAVNEGSALAIAAGSHLAGDRAVVLSQNSGFGNLINPLTSLVLPYRIPALVLMSLRGWPAAGPGEQQHHWMGKVSHAWLDALEIPHWTLGQQPFAEVLTEIDGALAARRAAFLLVPKGTIGDAAGCPAPAGRTGGPDRAQLVAAVLAEIGDAFLLSTTGYLSREVFNQRDRDRNFYMQGSMGHVTSVALGAALARPRHRFVVLDGDGAALMHLGALATVGHYLPDNLVHVVFDNGSYESTGTQATAAGGTRFADVARACGYRLALRVESVEGLREVLRQAMGATGPVFVEVTGVAGAAAGGRASEKVAPDEIADRFRDGIADADRADGGAGADGVHRIDDAVHAH